MNIIGELLRKFDAGLLYCWPASAEEIARMCV